MVHSHSIYVLGSDLGPDHWRRSIFAQIAQHISEGYAVAYVGDEDESTVAHHLSSLGMPISDCIDKGMLTLVNRDVFYSPFISSKILLEQWNKLFASIEKKAGKGSFKGFVAVGMPAESFFLSETDKRQLVQYESLAAEKYDGSSEAICLYTMKMIDTLPLKHLFSLLNAHENTGHRNGELREWNYKRAVDAIKHGFDSALGANVAEMALSIILRDFEMNEKAMVLHPDQLERKLEILLGESAGAIVLDHIKKELAKDIVF